VKLLAVDQDCVHAADRRFWRVLNFFPSCRVVLAVPRIWSEGDRDLVYEPEPSELRVIPMRPVWGGKSHRAFYPALPRIVMREQPDVLYVNAEPESFLGAEAACIKRLLAPRMSLHVMSWRNIDYARGEFPYALSFLNDIAERLVLRTADLCIARNQTAAEIFRRKGFHRSVVVPPALDDTLFTPRPPDPARGAEMATPRAVIGYVGRLVREKGVDLLLQAVASLDLEYSLHIVGGGPEKSALEALAGDLGIAEKITWVPAVPHGQVGRLISAMDILVLPSRTRAHWKEQFGRVLVEAMACGVPVVASDSGEIPHVLEKAGLLFPEGDAGALRTALQRMMTDRDLRESCVREGIRRVSQTYSLASTAEAHYRLFVDTDRRDGRIDKLGRFE